MAKCKHHPGRAGTVTYGGVSYCSVCKSQIAAAVKTVDRHVSPNGCFVIYEGGRTGWQSFTKKSRNNTGCAHYVAHQLNIKSGSSINRCLEGYTLRVPDLVRGLKKVAISDVKLKDIWTNEKLSHTGMVVAVKKTTGGKYVVDTKGSSLTVRSGPGTSNARTGSLKKGAVVDIVKTTGDWKQLKSGGWVHGDYLAQPAKITIRHDSSRQGKVADNDFFTYFKGNGAFYRKN